MDEVDKILDRVKNSLGEKEYRLLKDLAESYASLTQLVESKGTTIHRLRQILFGSVTEKTKNVLKEDHPKDEVSGEPESCDGEDGKKGSKKKARGHGRNGASAYQGAERIAVSHQTLSSGDACPECQGGKVYAISRPSVIIRVQGQAPLQAKVWELEKLRCNLCGKVFVADAPDGIGKEKYDKRAASMIDLLKYGSGLPFNRLAGLQGNLGIPLPPSTQWDIVNQLGKRIAPAFEELIRQAAQGEVVHNDDTTMKILEFMGKRKENGNPEEGSSRTGIFTSGIVSTNEGRRIALFFTGQQHAGENLEQVLKNRAENLEPPIQMCDALSRNTSPDFEAIVANCLAHGRRKFVEVAENFPEECRHVLETLREVYKNDAEAKKQGMSAAERLQFHRTESRPLMTPLRRWMRQLIRERKVEPNSSLGQAITYMDRHWKKLTLFLRVPGAPLDNNICEAALKRVILHRKNSLFYKTQKGAQVGDLFMSLIHTCQLSGANAFDYLTELQKHADDIKREPEAWMPWNYRQALDQASDQASA